MSPNNAVRIQLEAGQDEREQFATDVLHGLSQPIKTLPCKWFYDATGSELFEQITQTPEYYLTRVETGLLLKLAPELATLVPELSTVIEPGSGSSTKTRILLGSQPQLREYIPMDISADYLYASAARLKKQFPQLKISPQVVDFTSNFKTQDCPFNINKNGNCLVFFPGSTIGNFNDKEAKGLLRNIRAMVGRPCWLLIGVDMTSNMTRLLAAYNDEAGITAQFNRNLLVRINNELGADFNPQKFEHRAIFNIEEHRIEMHLVSIEEQDVRIAGKVFHFGANEFIHTENSYKYPRDKFELLLQNSGWAIQESWEDTEESGFGVFLLKSAA